MKINILLLSSLFFISACSSNVNEVFKSKNQSISTFIEENKLVDVVKVNAFKFKGWNTLTDDYLLLSSSPRRKFLVTLNGYCSDIRWAHSLLLNRTVNTALHARFDSVSTPHSPQIKCIIGNIYPVTKEQVTALMNIKNPPKEAESNDS